MVSLYEWPATVDYHEVIAEVEERFNVTVRDYTGVGRVSRFKLIDETYRQPWLIAKGYDKFNHVLNKPVGSADDWPKDSPEMAKRIEINTEMRVVEREWEELIPYRDYWRNINMCELNRGGLNYIFLHTEPQISNDDEEPKWWVYDINKMILEVVKDSPAYDKDEQCLTCHIDW